MHGFRIFLTVRMRLVLILAVVSCIVAVTRAGDADDEHRQKVYNNAIIKAVNAVAKAVKQQSRQCS